MANREGRKTVAAELPDDLYQRLEWCIGRTPADDPTVVLKRMSDVIRWMLDDSFTNCFDAEYQRERKAADAAAKRAAKKAADERNRDQKQINRIAQDIDELNIKNAAR